MKMTKGCVNMFSDTGFSPDEAANILVRATLMARLTKIAQDRGLTQRATAKLFGITPPHVNLWLNGKIGEFSFDVLVNMLGHARIARLSWARWARGLR